MGTGGVKAVVKKQIGLNFNSEIQPEFYIIKWK
jgi:hypothetical protein